MDRKEYALDLVEKILIIKINTYKKQRKLTLMMCYKHALDMIRSARSGNIEFLELWLNEAKNSY